MLSTLCILELEQNYNEFAGSIRGLSALEANVDQPLRQFAEATESYVNALKEMVIKRERSPIGYIAYFYNRENKKIYCF